MKSAHLMILVGDALGVGAPWAVARRSGPVRTGSSSPLPFVELDVSLTLGMRTFDGRRSRPVDVLSIDGLGASPGILRRVHLYLTRFQVTVPTPPLDAVG